MIDVVEIDVDLLAEMLTENRSLSYETEDGIPEGAKIIDAWQWGSVIYLRIEQEDEWD